MSYHQFKDDDGEEYGSFEVFYQARVPTFVGPVSGELYEQAPGWYWWTCFPGCLPDGEPNGPFDTEEEAINDAQGGAIS